MNRLSRIDSDVRIGRIEEVCHADIGECIGSLETVFAEIGGLYGDDDHCDNA